MYVSSSAAAELQDALQTYETKTVMLNQQLTDMALKVSTLEKREGELRTECESMAGYRDAEESRVADERSTWLEERKELEAHCETLQNQLTASLEDVASLTSRLEALSTEKHSTEQAQLELRTEYDTIKSRLDQAMKDVLTWQLQNEALSGERSSAEARIEHLSSECESLKQSITESQAEANSLREQLDFATSRISQLVSENESLDTPQGQRTDFKTVITLY